MAKNNPLDVDRHPTDEYRNSKGQMIKPLPGQHLISHADASTLAKKRWAKYRQAAAERMTAEIQSFDPSVVTSRDAWGLLAAKQAVTLMDSAKPRVDDLLKLGQIIGAMPTLQDAKQDSDGQTATRPPEILLLLVAEARKRRLDGDVIDVELDNG